MKKSLLVVSLSLLSAAALAYPDRPVTLVVPFSAGGPTDRVARDLGVALGAALGQTVVIENVGGAGGTLGATKVAKAAPDGYTLLLYHIGMATSASLYRNLPYRALDDFEYLGLINEVPMTLIGRPTLPANSYPELVKWLGANKGKVNLANAGLGAASHLCGLLPGGYRRQYRPGGGRPRALGCPPVRRRVFHDLPQRLPDAGRCRTA